MDRRTFLVTVGLAGSTGVAGCLDGINENDIQDTDGDGVIDSEDYAPRDPSVQQRSDLKATVNPSVLDNLPTTTPTGRNINLQTTTPTGRNINLPTVTTGGSDIDLEPFTPGPEKITPTATPSTKTVDIPTLEKEVSGRIEANYQPLVGRAPGYYKSYSLTESVIEFDAGEVSISDEYDQYRFAVATLQFEEGEAVELKKMDAEYVGSGMVELTLRHDFDPLTLTGEKFQLGAFAYPPDMSFTEAANQGEGDDIAYTDRLEIDDNKLKKDPHPETKEKLDTEQYLRASGEGSYYIEVSGQVSFGLIVSKSRYVRDQEKNLKQGITVARNAVRNGLAGSLAEILHDNAEDVGRKTARQKVNYVVEAIQSLPYVSDTVENGYNDFNKYPIETIVEGGGDCEDTAILLASALRAEPFGYGTSLIYLPPQESIHAATGVAGTDNVVGTYYEKNGTRYYYTETTGEGWTIGEQPSQYDEYSAALYVL